MQHNSDVDAFQAILPANRPFISLCAHLPHAWSSSLQLAAELKGKAGEIDVMPTDMSDSAAIDELAKKVLLLYCHVQAADNSAGYVCGNAPGCRYYRCIAIPSAATGVSDSGRWTAVIGQRSLNIHLRLIL